MLCLSTVIIVAACAYLADANSAGAPAAACDNLTPNHGSPQTSEVPYVIDLTPFEDDGGTLVYTPGRTYTLTLSDPSATRTFRGFFVQSRLVADDTTRVGVFATNEPNSRLSSCPVTTDGITHVQQSPRLEFESMTMQWTAPAAGTGSIKFAYAVVEVFNTFWANQRSDMIQEAAQPEPVPSSTIVSPSVASPPNVSGISTSSPTSFVISTTTTTSSSTSMISTPSSPTPSPTPGDGTPATATALAVSILSLLASGVGAVLLV